MTTTDACRNCGAMLAGRWCHACGQDVRLALRPWRELLAEWSDSVLGWETRTGRTLRSLCLEPGRLTVEYAAGRRASWLHPLRLYLGVNVFALAVFGATSDAIVTHYAVEFGPQPAANQFGAMLLEISAAMILLLPAAGACMALAFGGLGRYYAEHLVYTLHFAAFALLLQAAASLAQYLLLLADGPFWSLVAARWTAYAAVVVYSYLATRRAYGQGVLHTLLRTLFASLLFVALFLAVVWLMVGRGG